MQDQVNAPLTNNMAVTEEQDRESLSCAFRLAEAFGFHEGICNHFSVRLDSQEERYLINPYGVHWSQITADTLLTIDAEGSILRGEGFVEDTARFIHIAGHRANPKHKAILHTHMPYATAITMIENGRLEYAHQTVARFYGRLEYQDTFGGLALSAEEGDRLAQLAKDKQHVDVTFLANHGVVVAGKSVAAAFDDLYYLERACRQQLFAQQTSSPLKLIPEETLKLTATQISRDIGLFGDQHFNALCKVLKKNPHHRFTF